MVDTIKRELNKLCKAYNEIHDFNNMHYVRSKDLNLYRIKESLKVQIEEILKDSGYTLGLNPRGTKYVLRRFKE